MNCDLLATLQNIKAFQNKHRRFWYLDCYIRVDDVNKAAGSAIDRAPSSSINIRARSFEPLWGGIKYLKRVDALNDVPRWKEIVWQVLIERNYAVANMERLQSSAAATATFILDDDDVINEVESNALQPEIEEQTEEDCSTLGERQRSSIASLRHNLDDTEMASLHRLAEMDCSTLDIRGDAPLRGDPLSPNGHVCDENDDQVMTDYTRYYQQDNVPPLACYSTRIDAGNLSSHRDWHQFLNGMEQARTSDEETRDFVQALDVPASQFGRDMTATMVRSDAAKRFRVQNISASDEVLTTRGFYHATEERHEIDNMRKELEDNKRLLAEANARLFETRMELAKARKCQVDDKRKRAKPSSAPRGTEAYNRWLRRHVCNLSMNIGSYFGECIFTAPSLQDVDVTTENAEARDGDELSLFHLGEILAALTKKHEGLLGFFLKSVEEQRGVNAFKQRMKEVEEDTVASMQKQLSSVAVLLLSHLGVSHDGYQKLVNATSWSSGDDDDQRVIRVMCRLGTPMCRWPPLRKVLEEIEATSVKLGLVNMGKGAARMDCKNVLIDQLQALARAGLITIVEGDTIWVQILGDATGIWRSLKMNGTTIVLKVRNYVSLLLLLRCCY